MPPVARAEGVKPAGDREAALLELVESKFGNNITRFASEVAKRTGNTTASEKSSFYRIIRGQPGRLVNTRLRIYADVLGVSPKPFRQAWEEDEVEAGAESRSLPLRLSPREVRDALETLQGQVARLQRQVDDLERRRQPRRRQGGTGR